MYMSSAFYTLVVFLVSLLFVGLVIDAFKNSQCAVSDHCDEW